MAKQTFTTGQVLTAAQMTSLQQTAMLGGAATAKTASYVLVAADAGGTVIMNAAGSTTITVNTGLFAAGDTVTILNIGAGTCTVTAGTATVSKPTNATLALVTNAGGILYFTATGAATFLPFDVGSAASTGALTKISRTSFSNVAGTNIDSVFSSTYKMYLIAIEDIFAATNTDDLLFQFRYGSTTESNPNYYGNYRYLNYSSTTQTIVSVNGGTSMTLNLNTGFSGGVFPSALQIWVAGVGNANEAAKLWGSGMDAANYNLFDFGGWSSPTPKQTYTGFRLSSSSTNITGNVTVYGLSL